MKTRIFFVKNRRSFTQEKIKKKFIIRKSHAWKGGKNAIFNKK